MTVGKRQQRAEAFVDDICKYAAMHTNEIRQLTNRIDQDSASRDSKGKQLSVGVQYEMKPLPKPVELLVGAVTMATI